MIRILQWDQLSTTERGAALHALVKFARLSVQITLLCVGAWLAITAGLLVMSLPRGTTAPYGRVASLAHT